MKFFLVFVAICMKTIRSQGIEELISIRLYSNGNSSNFEESVIGNAISLLRTSQHYDLKKPLVLLIHGMNMKASSRVMRGMVDAFGKSGKSEAYNVLSMHMPTPFKNEESNLYFAGPMENTKIAGNIIGIFLCDVIKQGLTSPGMINLIGYSLGAQSAGYAARLVKRHSAQINYIAGLDPAGFGFTTQRWLEIGFKHVSKEDALTTHLVHTNALYYASKLYVGTADFVFNNGMIQPGCNSTGCSHTRAVLYFTEALLDDEAMRGRQCHSWWRFVACTCQTNPTSRLSFPPDTSAKGSYYLYTRGKHPFSLGEKGTKCYSLMFFNWLFENNN